MQVEELNQPASSLLHFNHPSEGEPSATHLHAQLSSPPEAKAATGHFRNVFISTFLTIFLAELGDKTQFATLLMTAESHNPWVVFAGAGSALIATSLIGVVVGRWLATRLSPRTLDIGAGTVLLLLTAWLLVDVVQVG